MARNENVEKAVWSALAEVDRFLGGKKLAGMPTNRAACDEQLKEHGSVRLASLFLASYALTDSAWDFDKIPTGIRGKYGDKLLSEELKSRSITLHENITAFGENLGWKGNVANVRLSANPRFKRFCATLKGAPTQEREKIASYLACRFAESRRLVSPIPPIGESVLSFVKAKLLFSQLLGLATEGHVQQFLIAALLHEHRCRFGFTVRTHHPHAADRFDGTAGDIEEFHDGQLVRAYEVTVRTDWKNRLSNFREKMDRFKLSKYVIIAGNVNEDEELAEPARLLTFLEPYGRDIAVVDIQDVTTVMSAELTAEELRRAVNRTYDYLCQPDLCGRATFQEAYWEVVREWLDQAGK